MCSIVYKKLMELDKQNNLLSIDSVVKRQSINKIWRYFNNICSYANVVGMKKRVGDIILDECVGVRALWKFFSANE